MSAHREVSIDELKRLQRDADLGNLHLVWLGPEHFNLAHTDAERASGKPLEGCALHRCLADLDQAGMKDSGIVLPLEAPAETGYIYVVVPEEPDDRQASIAEIRCPYTFHLFEEWNSSHRL